MTSGPCCIVCLLFCRWYNQLCPHLKKESFDEDEDCVIIKVLHRQNQQFTGCCVAGDLRIRSWLLLILVHLQAHTELGNKWAHIAKLLPGR